MRGENVSVEAKRRRGRLGFTVLAFGFGGMGALTLAWRFLFLPLAHGVGVADYDLVHPGEGLREQHGTLEETQVSPVQRQREDHVFFLFWKVKMNQGISELQHNSNTEDSICRRRCDESFYTKICHIQ